GQFVREHQDLTKEWRDQDERLVGMLSKPSTMRDSTRERLAREKINEIEGRLGQVTRVLQDNFPGYVALSNPKPASLHEAQRLLKPDEALLALLDTPELKPMPEETFIWVVTKSDLRWVKSELGTSALTREVTALRCGLDDVAWDPKLGNHCSE